MLCLLLLTILGLILFPSQALSGASEGIRLCGTAVIPALLPYLFISKLLLSGRLPQGGQKRFLGIHASCLPAYLLSFVGGYPVGVAAAVSLYESGHSTRNEIQRFLRVCNHSGPGFFVAVIGSEVLKSTKLGFLLYLIHVLSALLCTAMVLPNESLPYVIKPVQKKPESFPLRFQAALYGSCNAMLQVCCLVILFSVLISLCNLFLPPVLTGLIGLLELSNGVLRLQGAPNALILCAFYTGWGGLCVHLQAMSLWQSAGLQVRGYWSYKLLHGVLSAALIAAIQHENFVLFSCCVIFPIIFSHFRKKWGSKFRRFAL